ncbi:methyltransferase [Nemorincola caseinilytica]|uniref:tRNA1(Val) (adenine(37)-N6)-methyltransferase n=1 Tax=Nemorincola caseinilytica TaxID=2054315 RepID=A0ABP8NRR5_9BACT
MVMSNTWFRFKQFGVEQEHCAMKVTTDACIQGAWTPLPPHTARVLDIGTGTGLLTLMLAQRNNGLTIDAVEYDEAAAQQARANAAASVWGERIRVIHADIRAYTADGPYDVIICNPPFFSASLLGDAHSRNMARHDVSLTRHELLRTVAALLADDGYFSLLLPYTEYQLWKPLAATCGLYEQQCLHIAHRPGAPVKRVVSILGKHHIPEPKEQLLVIKDVSHDGYTTQFRELLGDFYLSL